MQTMSFYKVQLDQDKADHLKLQLKSGDEKTTIKQGVYRKSIRVGSVKIFRE